METVFDALKAMGKATSVELAARLDISREEVLNGLWELKKAGFVDKDVYTWYVSDNEVLEEAPDLPESSAPVTVTKISEQNLTAVIEQSGPQTADELATLFGTTSRKVALTLAMAISKGRLIRVNQNGKFRYCMPGGNLPAQEAATQEEIKTETVADIVQSQPSVTEKRVDNLVLPSLRQANRELRRAKSDIQKWERVCAALRELNKHRDILRKIAATGEQ
ncbi:hypothetical protein CTY41_22625 [Escherichia coli]|uniref:DUF1627 domain-containing protein n=1 Tax=Escherichia coli TaxID=562 RepID=UPI000BE6061B|nr:DUF1627 domain-containing protein [Escherichia coli]PJI61369.1 hypothetical protein CTY41_22625 [Escherichia coli]